MPASNSARLMEEGWRQEEGELVLGIMRCGGFCMNVTTLLILTDVISLLVRNFTLSASFTNNASVACAVDRGMDRNRVRTVTRGTFNGGPSVMHMANSAVSVRINRGRGLSSGRGRRGTTLTVRALGCRITGG